MTRVVLNQSAIDDLSKAPAVPILENVGGQVAERAAQLAPKRTGAGAASIHAEAEVDGESAVAKVSWAPEFFYLYFHEMGTSKMSARPFLRPALDGTYNP